MRNSNTTTPMSSNFFESFQANGSLGKEDFLTASLATFFTRTPEIRSEVARIAERHEQDSPKKVAKKWNWLLDYLDDALNSGTSEKAAARYLPPDA